MLYLSIDSKHIQCLVKVCTVQTKELSKQVRDKAVEKYRSGLGYKKRSETLNIPQSTIKYIIKKMERIWYCNKPAKRGLPT